MLTIREAGVGHTAVCDPWLLVTLPPNRDSPLLQTLRWAFRPIPFMEECRARYGDSFSVRFLGFERPMVLISDPAAIKALYREPRHGLPPGRNIDPRADRRLANRC